MLLIYDPGKNVTTLKYVFFFLSLVLLVTTFWLFTWQGILLAVACHVVGTGYGWYSRIKWSNDLTEALLETFELLVSAEAAKAKEAGKEGKSLSGVDSGKGGSGPTTH